MACITYPPYGGDVWRKREMVVFDSWTVGQIGAASIQASKGEVYAIMGVTVFNDTSWAGSNWIMPTSGPMTRSIIDMIETLDPGVPRTGTRPQFRLHSVVEKKGAPIVHIVWRRK